MRQLIIYLFILIKLMGSLETKEVEISINLPDKSGYQSSVTGTDKHKYGYELKENNHFHHTNTGKQGVRLGCFGFEIDGRKYYTQYVADSKGYRIVHSSQDLITVYPKTGGSKKASMYRDGVENGDDDGQVQYFFPKGCKGIDVLIDNSSRLRALVDTDQIARLPVTLKTTTKESYVHSTPPNNYIPPGPVHIYTPDQLQPSKPSNAYLPPKKPSNAYLPPRETTTKPANVYLPPTKAPSNAYIPPQMTQKPPIIYLPPETSTASSPSNIYLPPDSTTVANIENVTNVYLPPDEMTSKPPQIDIDDLLPPFEEDCCCSEGGKAARLVIPVPLKMKTGSEKKLYAKLIIPIKGLNSEGMKRISETLTDEIDVAELVKAILKI